MNRKTSQYVDSDVTRKKFKLEIDEFKKNENTFRKQGIICTEIDDLSISLLFSVVHLQPQPIAFAVVIDYTNWDVEAPSIAFIDPFSREFLSRDKILIKFWQSNLKPVNVNGGMTQVLVDQTFDLLQGGNGIFPFLCVPGVREYHNHPAHSGDPWFLYRTRGEGKLCELIMQLYSHSIAQSTGYSVQTQFKIEGIHTQANPTNKMNVQIKQ